MANSLIPYSFVPGTKAMASEVNANFLALANSVEEGRQYTNSAIENFNKDFEARLDEYDGIVGEKLQPNMANSLNISNCIIEHPKRIKYTLSGGRLTIKAGSVVIVPYGKQDLSSQYSVGKTFINDKFKIVDTQFTSSGFFIWVELQSDISAVNTYTAQAVTFAPLAISNAGIVSRSVNDARFTYNTSSNKVMDTSLNDVLSFPVMIATINSDGYESVEQVFHGMGYMDHTFWLDKNVKLLMPDGLYPDGTYKNFEEVTGSLYLYTCDTSLTRTLQPVIFYNGSPSRLSLNAAAGRYFESYLEPSQKLTNTTWVNLSDNIMYHAEATAGDYSVVKGCLVGYVDLDKGKINSFTCRPVLKIADIYEVQRLIQSYNVTSKAANGYVKLGDGVIIQWGTVTRSGSAYTVTLPTPFTTTNYTPSVIDNTSGEKQSHASVTSLTTTAFGGTVSTDATTIRWLAIGY